LTGPDFIPPFSTYPSGHAGLGGALFEMLRRFYGTDTIAFTRRDGTARSDHCYQALRVVFVGLSSYPLVVRQDRGDCAGPENRATRDQERFHANMTEIFRLANDDVGEARPETRLF